MIKTKNHTFAQRFCLILVIFLINPLFSPHVNALLSARTVNSIEGTAPYLTFDNGVTKATDLSTLLAIKLSNGTRYDQNNTSTAANPINYLAWGKHLLISTC
ncbi:hypothetical protein PT273_06120 [Orbaceae bacterium ESL0727]|nr:hypothetical protein [Orbaceae bacterium ESL0727]